MIRLAHQYGWDEALWFAAPALLSWLGLRWANQRATAAEAEAKERKRQMEMEAGPTADEPTED